MSRTPSTTPARATAQVALDRSEKDEAIARLRLPVTAVRHMPTVRLRELSPNEIELVAAELAK